MSEKGQNMNSSRSGNAHRHVVASILATVLISPVHAQTVTTDTAPAAQQSSRAPRIGLALSGGGARGIAHIGVLKVLEELRVPVHCITGTSMGSIVGAGFASGSTPAKLEAVVLKTDWDSVFTDRPPRQEIAQRRKSDDYKTLFAPEYGLGKGRVRAAERHTLRIAIESYFRGLTESAVEISDFQRLPIPFRAVAADIETGEAVVLDRGSISQAMRASMSVPGAMAPVEINGRLLVDGGIANNLPIDEARKLCADVIIAVDISTPPLRRDQITSALRSRPNSSISWESHGRAAGQELDRQGRPDLTGTRRHFRRQLRTRQRRHPHR
jgi:NTE family protein